MLEMSGGKGLQTGLPRTNHQKSRDKSHKEQANRVAAANHVAQQPPAPVIPPQAKAAQTKPNATTPNLSGWAKPCKE